MPLDQTFTYAVNGVVPAVGARVLVPFSGQRLMGVVVRVHDDPSPAGVAGQTTCGRSLNDAPLLPDELMRLAEWIAQYYVAPLGEVLRGMMPLAAEVRRQFMYRIAEAGRRVLYEGAEKGSSRRSKLSVEDQNREYAVAELCLRMAARRRLRRCARQRRRARRCSMAWCARSG